MLFTNITDIYVTRLAFAFIDVSPIGPGAKPGSMPTDLEQATGLERAEILAKIEGQELFDMEPLMLTHVGTKSNPILVKSVDPERYVGCTG